MLRSSIVLCSDFFFYDLLINDLIILLMILSYKNFKLNCLNQTVACNIDIPQHLIRVLVSCKSFKLKCLNQTMACNIDYTREFDKSFSISLCFQLCMHAHAEFWFILIYEMKIFYINF